MSAFTPERLVLIRERRGWSRTHLASAAGVAERAVRQYESGEAIPRDSSLRKLAEVLDVPAEFLGGPPIEGLGEHAATFRAATKLPAYRRRSALAAGSLAMHLADWIAERFDLPSVRVLDLAGTDAEVAADAVRAAWGLGNKPAPNMVHLLESKGVLVFALAEDCRELDAFAFWRHGRPFVLLNTMKSGERGRFDAAHELAHLVLHREIRSTSQEHEEEAQRFASAFLMPYQAMRASNLYRPTLSQILEAKKAWQVAATAFTRRLHQVGLIGDWHYRSLMIELSQRGYRSGEPRGIQREGSQLLAQVMAVMREEGVTLAMVASDLALHEADLVQMLLGLAPAVKL